MTTRTLEENGRRKKSALAAKNADRAHADRSTIAQEQRAIAAMRKGSTSLAFAQTNGGTKNARRG